MLFAPVVHAAGGADCLLGWRVANEGAPRPASRRVVCRDGDPACDLDGMPDGACGVATALCRALPGCEARAAGVVDVRGASADTLRAPPGGGCGPPVALRVRAGASATVQASTDAGPGDRDRLRITCARTRGARAVVTTTDFETGILATLAAGAPGRVGHPDTPIHSDAVMRTTGGHLIVLNRFLGDNVQVLDPKAGFRTRLQCSTGIASNPHDIAAVAPDKAYVTRYGRPELWIVDPTAPDCQRFRRGTIDLSAFADADGLPEMSQMAFAEGRLFVSVQRLDRARGFRPTGPSRVVVIDPATDAVIASVRLTGANAFGDASGIVREPETGKLVLGTPGDLYRVGDGGLERVDPATLTADGPFLTEEQVNGNVTDFVLLSPVKGYAVVQARDLRNRLVVFDPSGATPPRDLLTREGFLPDVALGPDGAVWLADTSQPTPGLRRFDPVTDRPLPPRVLDVGLLPFSIGFTP